MVHGDIGTVVGFFTRDSLYEAEAARMSSSVERLHLPVELTPVDGTGSWVRNAGLKARFLYEKREKLRGPLLYVDVDAFFHSDPWPILSSFDCDLGVHFNHKGKLLSGTILINDTPSSLDILRVWVEEIERNPDEWDQVVLQRVVESAVVRDALKISYLPNTLCWVTDNKNEIPEGDVVIEHLQASRETNDAKRWFGRIPSKLKRRRKRILELEKKIEK